MEKAWCEKAQELTEASAYVQEVNIMYGLYREAQLREY
jgi:hypothetical protein